jgi:hypothetical protein
MHGPLDTHALERLRSSRLLRPRRPHEVSVLGIMASEKEGLAPDPARGCLSKNPLKTASTCCPVRTDDRHGLGDLGIPGLAEDSLRELAGVFPSMSWSSSRTSARDLSRDSGPRKVRIRRTSCDGRPTTVTGGPRYEVALSLANQHGSPRRAAPGCERPQGGKGVAGVIVSAIGPGGSQLRASSPRSLSRGRVKVESRHSARPLFPNCLCESGNIG